MYACQRWLASLVAIVPGLRLPIVALEIAKQVAIVGEDRVVAKASCGEVGQHNSGQTSAWAARYSSCLPGLMVSRNATRCINSRLQHGQWRVQVAPS